MTFGFATRIALLMAVILGTGVAATGGLSVHKFERTLADFLASRFEFVVSDIRQRIETQMDLGLALSGLQGVSERLEGYIRADQQILSIEVFDDTGAVLFSTDPSFVGDLVAEEWMIAWRTSRGRDVWSDLERDAGVGGAVAAIDCYRIGGIARRAGAPQDKGAGIDLCKKVGDRVAAGEPIYRIHANADSDLAAAAGASEADDGFRIG